MLENLRGLFLVPKLRSILVKLIYNSISDDLEEQLSPSNIGARKGKAPRDHLFVVYSVINEVLRSKEERKIDLVFYDISDCFNALWVTKSLLDLHSNGLNNSYLNLLHELSKSANFW